MIKIVQNPFNSILQKKNTFLSQIKNLLFIVLLFGLTDQAKAQVSAYTFSGTNIANTSYVPLSAVSSSGPYALFGTTTLEDNIVTIPIGFSFNFNGQVYTNVNVSYNGFITFGGLPTATNYNPISDSSNAYSGAIAAYGSDLTPSATPIDSKYYTSGSVGTRVLTIEYLSVRRRVSVALGATTGTWSFQINLYEGTNIVEIKYRSPQVNFSTTAITGQIGLRGTSNADFNNLSWSTNGNWPSSTYPTLTFISGTNVSATTTNLSSVQTKNNNTTQPVIQFQWTPSSCSAPSFATIPVTAITSTTATLNWTAVTPNPASGYDYAISTTLGTPTAATGNVASGSASSLDLSSLSSNTTYYVYIRSNCGGSTSSWSSVATFTTLCTPLPDPLITTYSNDFGSPATIIPTLAPNLTDVMPACTSRENAGLGNNWTRTNGNTYYTDSGFGDSYMMIYNGQTTPGAGNAANAWFFTEGINLTANTTYQISFKYGGTFNPSTAVNKLKIAYGTSPNAASMTLPIDDLPNIKGSPFTDYVNFTVPNPGGVYYFGFNAYSAANQGKLYLDNVQIVPAVCLKPSAVTVANIAATSAVLSWTAPSPAPAQGYVYYYAPAVVTATSVTAGSFVPGNVYEITSVGTTNFIALGASANVVGVQFTATGTGSGTGTAFLATAPTNPTNASTGDGAVGPGVTNVTLTGLSSATVYYFWVRTSCGDGDYGQWVPLTNGATQYFTTLYQPSYCIPVAPVSSSSFISNFTTTGGFININNSTAFSTGGYGNYSNLFVSQAPGGTINFTTTITPQVRVSIWVDWNNDGTFDINTERVYNSGNSDVSAAFGSFNVPGLPAPQPQGEYRMRIALDYWATSPVPCGFLPNGSGDTRGEIEDYTLKVVPSPPMLRLNSYSSVQCAGTNSPLVSISSSLANYSIYSWSPSAGVTETIAGSYIFNSNITTVFTLTATQNSAPFSTQKITYTYTAKPIPTVITIAAPLGTNACPSGNAIPLTASGGIISGTSILSENFNSVLPATWTADNASSGGANTVPAWTLRPDGYNPGLTSGVGSMSSNDASQFLLSNSDGQGSGTQTMVTLTSPSFSLVGYTAATVSFYHYYKPWINGFAQVSISTDNGGSYTILQTWGNSSNTVAQGSARAFTNVSYNLTPYLGNANVKIRFYYEASWGYVWALDNFLVTGSAPSSLIWNTATSPVANGVAVPGLFTTAAGTTAYIAGSPSATVYAIPSATTTYSAITDTPSTFCPRSENITVTLIPAVAGRIAGGGQTLCSGSAPTNLTLNGQSGTVVQWQWSTSPTFASGINNIPSSASATLTGAQIGAITTTTYYRVETSNGSCSSVFTNPVVINVNSNVTTWNGTTWSSGAPTIGAKAIFNGNYNSSGDVNACSVLVSSGTVTFASGHTLTSNNEVTVTGGTLRFMDSSSLVQINSSINTGNIDYKRTTTPMINFDYSYWSAPVNVQEIHAFSPLTLSDKFYLWDTGPAYNWLSLPSSYNMIPGTGYIIRAPQGWSSSPTSWTGTFTGVPNNGDISTPIVVSGTNNVNLIGNPYPCSLNADLFLNDTGNVSKIQGSIYLWTHNTPISGGSYTSDDYAVWNIFGATGTSPAISSGINNNQPNGHVAAGNAFFVEGITNGNVTFNNTMREAGNNNFFFRMNAPVAIESFEKHRLWLEISNDEGLFKQILLGYAQDATSGRDRSYDAVYLDAGNPLSIYSIIGQDYFTINANGLPFNDQDIHPLGYNVTTAGAYKIDMPIFDGLFEGQDVYLEDKLLNVIHDLKRGTYNFTTEAGTFNERFVLRFTTLALGNPQFNANSVVVYKNEQGLHVTTGNIVMKSVIIYDVAGRLITSQDNISASQTVFTNLPATNQVLLVKITSETGETVTKKVVY